METTDPVFCAGQLEVDLVHRVVEVRRVRVRGEEVHLMPIGVEASAPRGFV
jgi:hypothetical protein